MNKTAAILALSARINSRSQSLEELTQIFEDYKILVAELAGTDAAYKSALQHLPEEFPDLQRLVGRKHDAILKGRLIDAVSTLKKKVEGLEAPNVEPLEKQEEATSPEKRIRNTPNLGMD
jgi:hypothetical protein